MLFPIPDPNRWTDPGPVPVSRWTRLLYRGDMVSASPAWLEQYRAWYNRLAREQEEADRAAAARANYEAMMAEYAVEGEHLKERLPVYLHKLGLSYRRTVQDRKTDRYYERVDYCRVANWHFDEFAFHFRIDTDDLPFGVSIPDFFEDKVTVTLTVNFNAAVKIEKDVGAEDRAGLWVVVEHRAGRGIVPKFVDYSKMYKKMPATAPPLTFPVGVGANGKSYYADMDQVVTVLVVGSRGAGKSNTINTILGTWLQRNGPDKLRLFLTDLKGGLEFDDYSGVPHLGGDVELRMRLHEDGELEDVVLGKNVLTEPYQVIPVLKYLEKEMERRQAIMRGKARKISAYNKRRKPADRLSHWVLVVDELATLMDSNYSKEAKSSLGELARKGRAVGIYLILATQIPDKSVLHRQVAGNMDCRIVGRLADGASSALSLGDGSWDATRLPLDLPGRMIWRWSEKTVIQAPFINEMTIRQIIRAAKNVETVVDPEETAIAEELFTYALEFLGGSCTRDELYQQFKGTIAKYKITKILLDWEVRKDGNGQWGPAISLGEDKYYLLPQQIDNDGRIPRKLIDVTEFKPEMAETPLYTAQRPSPAKNGKTVRHRNGKTPETVPAETLIQPIMEAA